LGHALQAQGQLDGAVASYAQALEIKPDFADAHYNLGNALKDLGQTDGAVASYAQSLEIKHDFSDAHYNLGLALQDLGQPESAAASYIRALEIKPDYAVAYNNLGIALKDLGQLDAAVASYAQALEIKPDYAETHCALGDALQAQGQLDGAVASYRRALEVNPDYAEALCALGYSLSTNQGQLDAAVASYRRALEIKPDLVEAHSNLLFDLSHSEAVGAQALFGEHCRFAEQFEAPLRANWPRHSNSRNPERCLQVGFVSGDLRNHAVAHFIEPVLARLADYPQLSLHAYSNHIVEDSVTQRLCGHFAHWHAIAGLPDTALAQKIRADGIDILIDLSGHTAQNRLLTFARKPAPIQITWIGYPNTTGLRAMDYVLMDRFNAPYGAYERYYEEKLARLPTSRTFLPVADAPPVNDLPALSAGRVTFGSFNCPNKLGDGVIALWSQVLRAVPGSRLLMGSVGEGSLRANLLERFARCGVAADRLTFQPRMEMSAYLALHHQVDFILDTFPYTGGTTTNHALWMGVPVLTMSGPSAMQCQCAGVLGRVGMTDWIAGDAEDFVRRAVGWAGRLDELAVLRAGMRDRLLSSPLRQPETVARGLETAFRTMWRRWCEGLPAESFEVELEGLGKGFPVGGARSED
jgi:predicted O-linked N-acetylglucosamine transferase (SPINDLY family)